MEPGSGVSMPRVVYEPRPGYTSQAMHAMRGNKPVAVRVAIEMTFTLR